MCCHVLTYMYTSMYIQMVKLLNLSLCRCLSEKVYILIVYLHKGFQTIANHTHSSVFHAIWFKQWHGIPGSTHADVYITSHVIPFQFYNKLYNKISLKCIRTVQYFQTVMCKVVHCYSQRVKECDFVHLHHHWPQNTFSVPVLNLLACELG